MSPKGTREIAKEVGVSRATLEVWLREGKIKRPRTVEFGGRKFRFWSNGDVERLKKYKRLHLYEGRGRKKKVK